MLAASQYQSNLRQNLLTLALHNGVFMATVTDLDTYQHKILTFLLKIAKLEKSIRYTVFHIKLPTILSENLAEIEKKLIT